MHICVYVKIYEYICMYLNIISGTLQISSISVSGTLRTGLQIWYVCTDLYVYTYMCIFVKAYEYMNIYIYISSLADCALVVPNMVCLCLFVCLYDMIGVYMWVYANIHTNYKHHHWRTAWCRIIGQLRDAASLANCAPAPVNMVCMYVWLCLISLDHVYWSLSLSLALSRACALSPCTCIYRSVHICSYVDVYLCTCDCIYIHMYHQ